MYTFEELGALHYRRLQEIAKENGIEYTTKDEVIEKLLSQEIDEPVLEAPIEPKVQKEIVVEQPVKMTETVSKPKKIRYSLDGRRLN